MGRLIIRSFSEDIKNFRNMIPYRKKKIEEASATALPRNYGVNELSAKLHPDKQRVRISSVEALDGRTKIITFSSADKTSLAPFRAGQGINIKVGTETEFFPVVSVPDDKDYSIIVSAACDDAVSELLLNADEKTELEISGPTGLFYYSQLRDGNSVVLICDFSGVASAISICRYLSGRADTSVRVIFVGEEENPGVCGLFENLSENICFFREKDTDGIYKRASENMNTPSALFVSGKDAFCGKTAALFDDSDFIRGRIRMYISDPETKNASAEKYSCQVLYRNESFSFECFANETLLAAFERNNIPTQAKCKVGECGYCRCKLVEGDVESVLCNGIDSMRSADKKYGFIHPCRSFPKTDIKVKL